MSAPSAAQPEPDSTWEAWERNEEGCRAFVERMDRIIAIDPNNHFRMIQEEVIIHPLPN